MAFHDQKIAESCMCLCSIAHMRSELGDEVSLCVLADGCTVSQAYNDLLLETYINAKLTV